jgi:hypothetical protein
MFRIVSFLSRFLKEYYSTNARFFQSYRQKPPAAAAAGGLDFSFV